MIETRCGLCCSNCSYREPYDCKGCIKTGGHPFHGECPVAKCAEGRGLVHCGQCPDFPCELLMQYSCDPEHGDHPAGARIRELLKWRNETTFGAKFDGMNYYSANPERLFDFYSRLGLRVMDRAAPGDEYFGASLALAGSDRPVMWIWRAPEGTECKNNLSFTTGGNLDMAYRAIRAEQ